MGFFSHKKFYNKVISFFVTIMFLAESTIFPLLTLLPRMASAEVTSTTISRTPATSQTNPYKVGDATNLSSINPPSIFATDQPVTMYDQIGTNAVRVTPNYIATFQLRDSGRCNTITGECAFPGVWDVAGLACPAGTTGVQQNTEWYTVGSITSNKIVWYFQCSGTTSPSTQTPVGYLDGIDANGTAFGWALDPDSSSVSISVHFYIDGAAGQGGTFAGSAVANLSRPDLNSAGYLGDHGFNFSIPSQWRDGKSHTLYVHGIDLSGDGSKNVLLSNVPKNFTLGVMAPSLSLSSYNFTAGTQLTVTVTNAAPNGTLKVFCRDPNNAVCDDSALYATNASGQFTHSYDTTGWTAGNYQGWVAVNGMQSNIVNFTVTAPIVSNNPSLSLSALSIIQGASFTAIITGAAPNAPIRIFSKGPDGVTVEDTPGITNTSGQFSRVYQTTGWAIGAYQGWVTVNGAQSNIVTYNITVPSGTIIITTVSLPSGMVSTPYQKTISASGGTGSYSWQITNGTLPPGLSTMTGDCIQFPCQTPLAIIGMPTLAGTYSFSAMVSDGTASVSRPFTIVISPSVSGAGLLVSPASVTVAVGQTQVLTAQWTPVGGVAQDITNQTQWSSSNPAVAELGAPPGATVNNVVLGRAAGSAIITATYQGQTAQAVITVTTTTAGVITISRTPATFQTNPYKVGDATTLSSVNPPSIFATDQPVTMYDQIGTNAVRVTPNYITTFQLRDSGQCNTTTGACSFPGVWDAAGLACPAGVSGVQQNTEWYTVGSITSNKLTWYFECSGSITPSSITVLSPNSGESYQTGAQIKIQWKTKGIAYNPDTLLDIQDDRISGWQARSLFGSSPALNYAKLISSNGDEYTYEYLFTVPQNFNDSLPPQFKNIYGGNHYKVEVIALIGGVAGTPSQQTKTDTSDAPFSIVAATITDRPAPTPTTAPMATLTLQRDQEQVTPDQPVSFSGALDSSKVAFPQGSSLAMAISDGVAIDRIEIDGSALASSVFSVNGGSIKIPFGTELYNGSHTFRIVLRNALSVQLDRRVSVWVTAVDAGNTLLLKGRTASTMMAHLPTEVIGKGVSLAVPPMFIGSSMSSNIPCCWASADPTHFSIREFRFGEMDITRGPFFTPNIVPILPDNIAFTLFPGDASMQRIALSLKQFSDPLAKEFITAQYQYILGRDPSSEEVSRYLPQFMQWRNPLAALMEVYNRRADVRQAIMVPRARHIGGDNDGSPRSSYDKLLEWAATYGWKEEPTLASFKLQGGFDDGWQLFKELWEKYWLLKTTPNGYENFSDAFAVDATTNPVSVIAYLCNASNLNHQHFQQQRSEDIDFEFCWKNDPMVRHTAILWAKDTGWAYNDYFVPGNICVMEEQQCIPPHLVTINPSGPILASMFGPGKYPEYAAEQQWRYPSAQMYYDLISSPEYTSFSEQRFRKNIDSIFRLFFSRPANESDIAWVKEMFLNGGLDWVIPHIPYDPFSSWINPQWEPNGFLIASNFDYIEDEAFLKNTRFITDDVYGIRHIPGEIDAVSARLLEAIEKVEYRRTELYQGDNFKRIVSGLYRLYYRRTPTDAEVESLRAGGKNFGGIEFKLNQSAEYGKTPASDDAIKNIYRNYLGRDPSDADVTQWGDKTISSIANSIGTGSEVRSYAQQHPENVYIFPIKKIKIVKCGFFCSVFGEILSTIIGAVVPGGGILMKGVQTTQCGKCLGDVITITNIVLNSISKGFEQAGFNGKTFVAHMSIARAMAGQAGGVFSMTNLMENADPTILDGFRTMARAPQDNAFAGVEQQTPQYGFASVLSAASNYLGVESEQSFSGASQAKLAQIDVSGHYGGGFVGGQQQVAQAQAVKSAITKKLVRGSRGAEVLFLQKILNGSDLTFLPQYQTGYFGPKTVAAVKRFQKRYGLEQVGFVGSKTRALLNSVSQ